MPTAVIEVATIPPRETLHAISRCLLRLGPRGLWREWLATLPSAVADELRAAECQPAPGAKAQAEAEPGGQALGYWPRKRQ